MSGRQILEYVTFLQVVMALTVLGTMLYRRLAPVFPAMIAYLSVLSISSAIVLALVFFRDQLRIPGQLAYSIYFYTYFVIQAVSLALILLIIYGIFSEAMRPFPGLQRVGQIVFRWVGIVSLLVAIALATGPEVFAKNVPALIAFRNLFAQLQQGTNVLILCLLIFVCFAIRPLGLTFRSHLFGVVLGLGIFSTVALVQAAWLVTAGGFSMYSPMQILGVIGADLSIAVWGIYFALPEPKRRMILLPTTSPFFLWNRISEILGDAPGHVAVAGFTPNMLAPAEIEMLTAATSRETAAEREREALEFAGQESDEADSVDNRSEFSIPQHAAFALSR